MKTMILGLAFAAIAAISSNSVTAMQVINIDQSLVGGTSTFTVALPLPSDGSAGTLSLGTTFGAISSPGFSVSGFDGSGFVSLTPVSTTPTLFPGGSFVSSVFTVPASLLTFPFAFFQVTQPALNASGNLAVRNFVGQLEFSAVPEPTSMALLGIGALVSTGAIRRRKRVSAASTAA